MPEGEVELGEPLRQGLVIAGWEHAPPRSISAAGSPCCQDCADGEAGFAGSASADEVPVLQICHQ